MTEILSMQQVVFERSGQPNILQIPTFTVKQGELVALVGPNGAGKSSLLRVINLLQPVRGILRLFGEQVNAFNEMRLRRRSAMVFQDTLLLDGSVYDNVAWPLRFRGFSDERIKTRVYKALEDFRCAHLAKRQAKQLSGGEAQRVCIARALVTDPELILLDEPFAALDVAARTSMIEELRMVAKSRNMTVLMVSHNYADVLFFAERVVALFAGEIIQDGTPQELLRRPKDERIARLVGIDNIMSCTVVQEADTQYVMLEGQIPIPLVKPTAKVPSFCCLPGDALYLSDNQKEPTVHNRIQIDGVIDRVVPAIGTWCVLFRTGDLLLSARLPRTHSVEKLQAGDTVSFSFDLDDAQFV